MKRWMMAGALLFLAACKTEYEPFDPEPFAYGERTPIWVNVGAVEVVDEHVVDTSQDFAQRKEAEPLAPAALALMEARYTAAGGTGAARAVLTEASLVSIPLETTEGFEGWFKTEPDSQLEGRLSARLVVDGADSRQLAFASTVVTRTRAVLENAGTIERQKIAVEFIRDLVDDLDESLEDSVRRNLSGWVRESP